MNADAILSLLQPREYYEAKPNKALDDVLRVIEALEAASTPPADDVREALTFIARDVHLHDGGENAAITGPHAQRIADAILVAFEVRPRGTVTPPGVDLVEVVSTALIEWRNAPVDLSVPHSPSLAEYVADAVWRAQGHHDSPETVTDAEVEAGAQALYAADPILYALPEWWEKIGTPKPWSVLNEGTRDVYRKRARPVLEAAREASS